MYHHHKLYFLLNLQSNNTIMLEIRNDERKIRTMEILIKIYAILRDKINNLWKLLKSVMVQIVFKDLMATW